MPTVKEGQLWTSDWVKQRANELGFDIRTYWRQPANGIDWHLELSAGGATEYVSIWFLHLKRLDEDSKAQIEEAVLKGLKKLQRELQVEA